MARPRARDLTERELEVMHAFWKSEGEATAAEIRDRLAESGLDRTYTTIATLVRNLEEKGFSPRSTRHVRSDTGSLAHLMIYPNDFLVILSIGSFGARANSCSFGYSGTRN